jgi:hypothetical protein
MTLLIHSQPRTMVTSHVRKSVSTKIKLAIGVSHLDFSNPKQTTNGFLNESPTNNTFIPSTLEIMHHNI